MTQTVETTLADAVNRLSNLDARYASRVRQHEDWVRAYRNEREELAAWIRRTENGLDTEKIALAETVITVVGSYTRHGDQDSVVNEAMQDIANGGKRLATQFFGTKTYGRFYNQRSDHPYGYGPRHGSIVFRVGINRGRAKGEPLSANEVEACLYYLAHLREIQNASALATTR